MTLGQSQAHTRKKKQNSKIKQKFFHYKNFSLERKEENNFKDLEQPNEKYLTVIDNVFEENHINPIKAQINSAFDLHEVYKKNVKHKNLNKNSPTERQISEEILNDKYYKKQENII